MRRLEFIRLLFIVTLTVFSTTLGAQTVVRTDSTLIVEGQYNGRNLYLQNPSGVDEIGFCIDSVFVNTERVLFQENLVVDLYSVGLIIGDPVKIVVYHGKGCTPRVINPAVLVPTGMSIVEQPKGDSAGVLYWKLSSNKGGTSFDVEQYKWGQWIKIGEVSKMMDSTRGEYGFDASSYLTSGFNSFRVMKVNHQVDYGPSYARAFVVESGLDSVRFSPQVVRNSIKFSRETHYSIESDQGVLMMQGISDRVDCISLPRGKYLIWFDNTSRVFRKR